jgi:long-subunit fatty acid transport protein
MTTIRAYRFVLVLTVASLGLAAAAEAQTNDEVFPQVQWNFSTPGARANGMGRTFIGTADDASAAVTNPAGLMSLTRPQVYAEYKNTDISVDRLATVDSFKTLQPTTFSSNINALSFLNFSMPVNSKLAVGVTLNQFLYYRELFNLSPRTLVDQATGNYINFATFGVQGDVDLKATSFSGSAAFSVTKELMVGVSVSANRLTAKTTGTRYDFNFGPTYSASRPNTDLQPTNIIVNQTSIDDSNVAPGFSFGAIYRANEMVSAGFNYTKSPKFTVGERFLRNAATTTPNLVPNTGFADPSPLKINVPDRFGVGVSVHPNPRLLVAADVVRINYSSLAKDFLITLNFPNTGLLPSQFSVDDATEVHFGGEYNVMTGKNPVFIRAGVFSNPNHTTRYTASAAADAGSNAGTNTFYNSIYNLLPRDTAVRGTIGAGVALGPRLQIDAAYVHRKEFVASTAVRF